MKYWTKISKVDQLIWMAIQGRVEEKLNTKDKIADFGQNSVLG